MPASSLHRKTAIFFGVQHSSGRKTLEIVKIRVFKRPRHLYTGLELIPHLYTGRGIFILMPTSSLHRKKAIFFGVKHSSGRKTHEIVKIRVFKRPLREAPLPIYARLVLISHLHTGRDTWFCCKHQVSIVKQPYFFGVKYSSGRKPIEISKFRVGRSRSAEISSCLMTYVHTFFETIENETKIKGTKKILPKIYCIEKKGPNVEN